jgi:hypothetical protein
MQGQPAPLASRVPAPRTTAWPARANRPRPNLPLKGRPEVRWGYGGWRGEKEKGEEELLTKDGGQAVIDLVMHAQQKMLRRWCWLGLRDWLVAWHGDSTTPSPALPSPPLPSPLSPLSPPFPAPAAAAASPSPAKRATHAALLCSLPKDSPARTA